MLIEFFYKINNQEQVLSFNNKSYFEKLLVINNFEDDLRLDKIPTIEKIKKRFIFEIDIINIIDITRVETELDIELNNIDIDISNDDFYLMVFYFVIQYCIKNHISIEIGI